MNKLKWMKGMQTASITVIVIMAFIIINIFISKKDMTYDVSPDKLYTISDQTKSILKENKKDITLYYLNSKNGANDTYLQIVKQYAKASKKIKIEYRDLENYPNFAKDYIEDGEEVSADSIIVVCGDKHRYISSNDYVNYSYDSSYNMVPESLSLESNLTSAINYVISEKTTKVYVLKGHKEADTPSTLTEGLQNDNYEIDELNLINQDAVPDDCNILCINAPTVDLSTEDVKKIETYLKKEEGKLYVILDALQDDLPNLFKMMEKYGVKVNKGVVAEMDSRQYIQQYPTYLLPMVESSDITGDLAGNANILLPIAKGLTIKEDTKDYTVTSLLTTSDKAFSKVDTSSNTVEKEKGDIDGPFSLSVLVSDDNGGKMIVFGCSNALEAQIDQAVSGSNSNLVLNGFNYLTKQESKISIRAKEISDEYAIVPAFWQKTVMMFSIFVIPVFLLVVGGFVVLRRRNL
ncbi:MAG: GldG family protein [Lachnospiraceae bacterium]